MQRRFLAVAAVLLAVHPFLDAQQPPPQAPAPPAGQTPAAQPQPGAPPPVTFRVEVNYVDVDVIVNDKQGNVIKGLTRDDFEVLEDNKPQKVELFSVVDIPVERADRPLYSPTAIEPDVKTNERAFEGRLFVIILDDMHANALRSQNVTRAARLFIERYMGANDVAAVVHTSGRTDAGQEFTDNKRLLLAAVDKFMGRKLRSSTLNRIDEYNRGRDIGGSSTANNTFKDPADQERAYNARVSMDTLKGVAQAMQPIRGRRKAVVLFSEGIDYDIYDPFTNQEASTVLDSVRDAIGMATRSSVAFYTVDPRGLATMGDENMELTPVDDTSLGLDGRGLQSELQRSQDSLRILAEETGAFAAVNSNDFRTAFERIIMDNSTYYVLGYYPTNERRDGRFRKIQVRVKGRTDVVVRSRRGYQAPRGKAPAANTEASAGTSTVLRDLLNSPLQESGLPMGVQAAAFKGPAPNASVLVTTQFAGRFFKFNERDGQLLDNLEVSIMALDNQGKVKGSDRKTVELTLRPQTRQLIEAAGFRVMSRLELPPGRYQLRVAARTVNGNVAGSVYDDVEVPDFSKDDFSISQMVLSSQAAKFTLGKPDEQLKDVLPGPPTIGREFTQADTITLFVEAYDNETKTPHKVDFATFLKADDGKVVFKAEEERSSSDLQGAKGGYGYLANVPLQGVTPGNYVLRVEAKSRLSGNNAPMVREAEIKVWPTPAAPSGAAQAQPQQAAAPQGVTVVNVARGPQSGVSDYREVLARNDEEFAALWGSLQVKRPPPKVNFANTMIAAVFVGNRPTSGYGVEIKSVQLDGDTLVVGYQENTPPPDMMTSQVITTPFAVAGVPMHNGPVRFEKIAPAAQ